MTGAGSSRRPGTGQRDGPGTGTDDAELGALVRLAGRGDEAAFADLYARTASTVHGIVRRVLRDPAMAEEVTQEVFVEIWRLAPRYDRSRGSAMAWAATIAHRRAVDRVRSEQSRRNREESDGRRREAIAEDVADAVTDELDRGRVRRALAGLTDTQREAVTLAYFGGYTYKEVAALLETPEGTIKTRIRDGLIKLRDQFGATP